MIGYGNSYFISTILDSGSSGTPPVNTVAPVISGSTTLGSVLSSTTGTWTGDAPISYSYQWKRNGSDIGGATSSTYTLVVADSSAAITCQVTATNIAGSSSATSNTITAGTYTAPVNTVAPVISGSTTFGSLLSSTTGTWTGTPTITYAYQWKRNGSNIIGATSNLYTVQLADSGASITCQVTATNPVGSASATSNTITINTFVAPTNTVAPAITGTAQEGQTVSCSTGTWTGTPTITYAYQWKRNGNNITSATSSTYTLVTADVGQSITCTVTATNFVGSASANSNTITPTSAVDPDAQAYFTANSAYITSSADKTAIDTFYKGLKTDGVYSKFKAMYLPIWSAAAGAKWNLKDPRDLDAAFRLTFASGWTHSAYGMTPSNAYADTHFNPLTQFLPRNSASMGVYNRTDTSTTGAHGQRVSNTFEIFERWTNNVAYCYLNDNSGGFQVANLDSRGFFQGSRTASNAIRLNINTAQNTGTQASTGDSNGNLWIGASNNGSTGTFFNNRQIAFFYIAEGFNNTEMQNIYTRVQTLMTYFGIQV